MLSLIFMKSIMAQNYVRQRQLNNKSWIYSTFILFLPIILFIFAHKFNLLDFCI